MVAAMPSFAHDGVEIAFLDEGEGEPIVLVHGFASNKEVNWVSPGWVSTLHAGRPPGHCARQSRPRRVDQALRSRRVSQRDHGRRRSRAARSSRPRARRRHGLLDGRAEHGVPRARPSRPGALGDPRRARHQSDRGSGPPDTIAQALEAPAPRGGDRSAGPICSARLPSRPDPTCGRLPPASAVRARLSRARGRPHCGAGAGRGRQHRRDRRLGGRLAALIPGAQASAIPGRDHMLAVGD